MRKTTGLFNRTAKIFTHPFLYCVTARIVLPISSINDYRKLSAEKNAFYLGSQERQVEPIVFNNEDEPAVLKLLHEREKSCGDHPVLSDYLDSLCTIRLSEGKLNEAKALMLRAVNLDGQNSNGHTHHLHRITNLAIIFRFDGNEPYSNELFEFCAKRFLEAKMHLTIDALPYFYNFLVTGDQKDQKLYEASVDMLSVLRPKLNNQQPFSKIVDALIKLNEPKRIVADTDFSATMMGIKRA